MTIEQFNKTRWRPGMRALCKPQNMKFEACEENIVAISFDQCLIATLPDVRENDEPSWWRCENCEIVLESTNKTKPQ